MICRDEGAPIQFKSAIHLAGIRTPDGSAYHGTVAAAAHILGKSAFRLIQGPVGDQGGIVHILTNVLSQNLQVFDVNDAIPPGHRANVT